MRKISLKIFIFQEKLYNEIITVVGNAEEITLDHINEMIYLDAVIKEALRLFPTAPATLRSTSEDIKLGNKVNELKNIQDIKKFKVK